MVALRGPDAQPIGRLEHTSNATLLIETQARRSPFGGSLADSLGNLRAEAALSPRRRVIRRDHPGDLLQADTRQSLLGLAWLGLAWPGLAWPGGRRVAGCSVCDGCATWLPTRCCVALGLLTPFNPHFSYPFYCGGRYARRGTRCSFVPA